MSREVPEADWKLFRRLREMALERFCERVLGEIGKLSAVPGSSFHARYLEVYRRIEVRDKELGRAFDDLRRSQMVDQLAQMRALGLIEEEDLRKFTADTQAVIGLLTDPSR